MEKSKLVRVTEGRLVWNGMLLWVENQFSGKWAVVQPCEYIVHARRGSGSREYSENLVRIPMFLDKVEEICEPSAA